MLQSEETSSLEQETLSIFHMLLSEKTSSLERQTIFNFSYDTQ